MLTKTADKTNLLKMAIFAAVFFILLFVKIESAKSAILFQDDSFAEVYSQGLVLDSRDQNTGDIIIKFGATLGESIRWNAAGTKFEFSDDVDLGNNQLMTAKMEHVSAMPGGAVGLGTDGEGRIVYLTAEDGTAPGCTAPHCFTGPYIWKNPTWVPLSGSINQATASKIVTVGPTGRDYTTIAAAVTYLNTLSGGEIWIDPGSYPVTTSLNVENIKLVGTDTSLTTVAISGSGKLRAKDTKFRDLIISVDAGLSTTMGIDIKYSASSNSTVEFDQAQFTIGTGKYLIDSSESTVPLTVMQFINCTETGAGYVLPLKASSHISLSSSVLVLDQFGLNPLKIQDWPVTIIGGSNVVTSGTITTVPDRTIYVSKDMDIQNAINSLGSTGGVIKLLVGVHNVTNEITIPADNIEIVGEGPGTIVSAPAGTWAGGTTTANAVFQIGLSNGTDPHENIILRNFKLQVGPDIHGVRVNGGSENKVIDMIIDSIGPKTGGTGRSAIIFTDGASTAGSRFTAARNIISRDTTTNRWIDGVHFDGNADLGGQLFGHGNGITDSIIYENIVEEARETSYSFSQVSASSIFSNRARNLAMVSTSFGMFLNDVTDAVVINNTIEGANALAKGIQLYDNVDNSIFLGNAIRGGTSNFDIGISIANATSEGNVVEGNQFAQVNTKIVDNGTNTKMESLHHKSISDPAVTDDITKGYGLGTIWVNTATNGVFISTDDTAGAAVWTSVGSSSDDNSHTNSNTFTMDYDNSGGDVKLQFGAALNESLTWNNTALRFDLSDDLNVTDSLTVGTNATIGGNTMLGTGTAATKLDIDGDLALRAYTVTLGNSNNNNVNISGHSYVRIEGPNNSFAVTGIAGGVNGKIVTLYNTTTRNMTISNSSGSSTAGNRILTMTGADRATSGTGSVTLIYDSASGYWIVTSFES